MNPSPHIDGKDQASIIRDLLNAMFGLLRGLAMHDLKNEAVLRPINQFQESVDQLSGSGTKEANGVKVKFESQSLTVNGHKIESHFSIVEAMKWIPECMEKALIEEIHFKVGMKPAHWQEFFLKWALHCSVMQRPKAMVYIPEEIDLVLKDPDKSDSKLKTEQVLVSSKHALQHYYVLRQLTTEFFEAVSKNDVPPLRRLRRELMEMLEISRVHPYQLAALSLIRADRKNCSNLFEVNACEAISTALLTILITKEFNFSLQDQLNLSLVGLLYNVGLLSEDLSKIVQSDAKLTQVEYRRVIDAQSKGVLKILRAEGVSRPGLIRLLSLFEASQASRKPSLAVSLESQLLRIVSSYVAMTSHRPYRDAYLPAEAVKLLGSRTAGHRDQNHLESVLYFVFTRVIGIYPVGSYVLLSNHKKGVVFRPNSSRKGIPLITLVETSEGSEEFEEETLDLGGNPSIEIVKALDPGKEGIQVSGFFFS